MVSLIFPPSEMQVSRSAPLVHVTHLSHRYADGRTALEDVCFSIHAGESVALVGPNGAGKTTLFLRLCGVLPGRRGHASIAGLDPADPALVRKLPERLGVVFQSPDDQLFSPTLFDDVAFGPLNLGVEAGEIAQRVEESLTRVGLSGYAERVPHKLSGGEKRRAALATVLSMRPEVLLLDEPTMFLDPRGRRGLIELLNSLPGTKLIATHDLEFVLETCSRVLILDAGQVAATGPTHELLAQAELMHQHGLEVPYRLRVPGSSLPGNESR